MMRHLSWSLLPVVVLLWLTGCQPATDVSPSSEHSQRVTTTLWGAPLQIEAQASDPQRLADTLQTAIDDLHYVVEMSHPWQPGPLARTNQLLALSGEFSAVPSGLLMLQQAMVLSRQTEGYYNPALGGLIQAWGLQQDTLDFAEPQSPEVFERLLQARPNLEDIQVEGIRMSTRNPQVRLDYGPFALGYALDTARQRLRGGGLERALLQGRNAVLLLGSTEATVSTAHYPELSLQLQPDEALYSVAIHDHHYHHEGQLIHPFVHPEDGQPVRGIASLAVLHPSSAATAAAQAQALLIAGEDQLATLAERIQVSHYLWRDEEGRLYASAAMRQRLKPLDVLSPSVD